MYRAVLDISGGERPDVWTMNSMTWSHLLSVWLRVFLKKCIKTKMRHWPAGPFPYSLTKDLRGERHFCEHWSDLYSYHRPLPRLPARCLHGPAGWSHHLLDFYVMFSTHCPVAMFNMATIKKRKTKRIAKKNALLEMNHLKIEVSHSHKESGFPTAMFRAQCEFWGGYLC